MRQQLQVSTTRRGPRAAARAGLAIALGIGLPAARRAQPAPPTGVTAAATADATDAAAAARARTLVAARRLPTMRWPRLDDVAADLRALYGADSAAPAAGALLWSRGGRPTPAARAAADALLAVDARGLRADDYDAPALARAAAPEAPPLATAEQRAAFDVTLSAGLARVARALEFGRIAPRTAHAELRLRSPGEQAAAEQAFDAAGMVRALAGGAPITERLDALDPPYHHYRLLVAALARYRALARDSTRGPVALAAALRPGDRDPGVAQLRRLLVALGDLPDGPAAADSTAYAGDVVDGVRRFQRRQGYAADGVVGPATRARLARPFAERAEQIALTLERWRWLPHRFAEPPVIVNVPTFRLHAFRSTDDREADLLSMDVVVGDAFDSRTPVFSDAIRYLVFSPYWDVPPGITRREVLPKARGDAGYLARNHYEVVDGRGRVLGTSPSAVRAVGAGSARIRQTPGPWNALGRVKFIFPNAHDVYLHDSPAKAAFARDRRDLSHGCVRVAEPVRLATFLLRDQAGWDSARVVAAMAEERPRQVNLARPVPVHIVYATAVAREDGRVQFADDIYGHDRALAGLLARGYPYPR